MALILLLVPFVFLLSYLGHCQVYWKRYWQFLPLQWKKTILFYHTIFFLFLSIGSKHHQKGHLKHFRPKSCSLKRDSDWADPGGGLFSSQTRPDQWVMRWNADSRPRREDVWMQNRRQREDMNVDENSHGGRTVRARASMRGDSMSPDRNRRSRGLAEDYFLGLSSIIVLFVVC